MNANDSSKPTATPTTSAMPPIRPAATAAAPAPSVGSTQPAQPQPQFQPQPQPIQPQPQPQSQPQSPQSQPTPPQSSQPQPTSQSATKPQPARPEPIKSAKTAGLLAIFLGLFGAHDWYLQKIPAGILHVSILVGGLIFFIVGRLLVQLFIFDNVFLGTTLGFISTLGLILIIGDFFWGVAEGISLLIKGDADLANQGYRIS